MQLWVGLGNPGAHYAQNRHNAGFMAVDAIAEAYRAPAWSKKFHALIAEINFSPSALIAAKTSITRDQSKPAFAEMVAPIKVLLLKPQQYMNRSGQAVVEAMRFYKLEPSAVTVFHDELDLPLGKLRVKTGGGHGGHNGLRDIDAHIGKDYRRVRLGIDHPGDKNLVTPYVLSDFTGAERKIVESWMQDLVATSPLLAAGDDAAFMNRMATFSL